MRKLKQFFTKLRHRGSKLIKSKFGKRKQHFSVFCKSLSEEVETILWESEAKRLKLFKSRFGYGKLPKKLFLSYLEFKKECSEGLKESFFSFLQIFE